MGVTAYTNSRNIQLFKDFDKSFELASFNPQVILGPMTKVDILTTDVKYSRMNIVYVEVLEGPHAKTIGLLPKAAVHQCLVRQVDGPTIEGSNGTRTVKLTGVKYGATGYVADPDEAENEFEQGQISLGGKGLMFELPMVRDRVCPSCGGARGDHKILEADVTRQKALALHGALRNPPAGAAFNQQRMLGVIMYNLKGEWRTRAAISGQQTPPAFIQACDRLKLPYVDDDEYDMTDLIDMSGQKIGKEWGKELAGQLTCAAPKLVQFVAHFYRGKGEEKSFYRKHPIFMTEVWYNGSNAGAAHAIYPDSQTIDSCDKCRLTIPRMLCGYENLYKKSSRK